MRLIRICTNYPAYLEQFHAQHPELQDMAYAEQYRALMDDCMDGPIFGHAHWGNLDMKFGNRWETPS